MTEITVIVTGPEEAYDNEAELGRAHELMLCATRSSASAY
jgi:hypothetical protein